MPYRRTERVGRPQSVRLTLYGPTPPCQENSMLVLYPTVGRPAQGAVRLVWQSVQAPRLGVARGAGR